ncbi:MAG: CoA pyrophosphatase [Gammaproteobacteria bacterium]|nr:CoA pyrophosphatase [Gammaproteobacteria bacterium]
MRLSLSDHNVETISRRVIEHKPELFTPTRQTRQAAVAVVLHQSCDQTQVLFIKRATVSGDPWSGHMAFPGGHKDDSDRDLVAAAVRETEEEIGLNLLDSQYIGPLSHQRAAPRGRTIDMLVAPHVFVADAIPDLSLNHEVDEVVWGSFNEMFKGQNHDVEFRAIADAQVPFNGYRIERRHFVWGLTYRTLQTLFSAVDPTYIEPQEPA